MPKESQAYLSMNSDDEQAARLASLIVSFSNAQGALSSPRVHAGHYPELDDDSFRRTFQRDRERLALCGFSIAEAGERDGHKLWEADAERSFANAQALPDSDALFVDVACAPLVDDPSFPYRDELRHALAKIDRSFAASTVVSVAPSDGSNARLQTLLRALSSHTCVKVTYRDAQGQESERALALYGSFGLRSSTYFVAARVEGRGRGAAATAGAPHVYRLDRFLKVAATSVRYEVPEDFCTEDYVRLAFQMGDTLFIGTFTCPDGSLEGRPFARKGTTCADGSWQAAVADARLAAAWAVAEGLLPTGPAALVDAYEQILKEAADVR